jgi:hypothetical protein
LIVSTRSSACANSGLALFLSGFLAIFVILLNDTQAVDIRSSIRHRPCRPTAEFQQSRAFRPHIIAAQHLGSQQPHQPLILLPPPQPRVRPPTINLLRQLPQRTAHPTRQLPPLLPSAPAVHPGNSFHQGEPR